MKMFDTQYPPIPWPVQVAYGGIRGRRRPDDPDRPSWKGYWREYCVGPGISNRWRAILEVIRYRLFRKVGSW